MCRRLVCGILYRRFSIANGFLNFPLGLLSPTLGLQPIVAGRSAEPLLHFACSLVSDARVIVRVYAIDGEDARLIAETPARYLRLEVIEQGKRIHIHPDGSRHVHGDATDVQGLYVAQVTFPRAGTWGLEILAQPGGGGVESARLSVGALEASLAPMVGTSAPRSRNRIAGDVADLKQIDSSDREQ